MDTKPRIISKDFVTEVAKYFMAFLETDFKKRTQPKRNLTNRVNKGLSTGLYLDKYPTLYRELYKNFVSGFPKESINIERGKYTTRISDRLVSLLEQRIDQLTDDEVQIAIKDISKEINQLRLDNQKDYDNFFETSLDVIKLKLDSAIVVKFLNDIEKSLEAAGWSAESGLYQLETDATDKVFALAEDSINEILEEYFALNQDSQKLQNELSNIFEAEAVRMSLKEFFKEFSASDAYAEILQLNRNKEMLDKTELYIYFGEVGINNFSFPLFYTPISVEQSETSVTVNFDSRVFVNIKAIEFVVQQNNTETSQNESVAGSFERIIYFEDKKELLSSLQHVTDTLIQVLGLTKPVGLKDATNQISNNMVTRVSNRLQLFLFDKSDEALINDYEEIITDQGALTEAFAELIDSFVTENPQNFIEEVAQEWEEKTILDKLIVDSPIALNEEQKQVLLALQKEDCKVAILEGPPGTGKSHTITAIVCKALLEGKSVLVLSDKEEALDVVQDKITDTLSTIRHDKNFQNPILRLGKSSRGLSKVIEGQALEKVREHMRAYRSRQGDFEAAENEAKSEAAESLNTSIEVGEHITLTDVNNVLNSERKFVDIDWVRDVNDDFIEAFKSLHVSIVALNNSLVLYLVPFTEVLNVDNIKQVTELTEAYANSRSALTKDMEIFVKGYKSQSSESQDKLKEQIDLISRNLDEAFKFVKESNYSGLKQFSRSSTISEIYFFKDRFNKSREVVNAVKLFAPNVLNYSQMLDQLIKCDVSLASQAEAVTEYTAQLQSLKSRVLGFSGKKSSIESLTRQLKTKLPYINLSSPEKHLQEFIGLQDILNFLAGKIAQLRLPDDTWKDVFELLLKQDNDIDSFYTILDVFSAPYDSTYLNDYKLSQLEDITNAITAYGNTRQLQEVLHANEQLLSVIKLHVSSVLAKPSEALEKLNKLVSDIDELQAALKHRDIVDTFVARYEDVAKALNINGGADSVSVVDPRFLQMDEQQLSDYLNDKVEAKQLSDKFKVLATDTFSDSSQQLYNLNAAKMANILDTRIIDYVDNHAADIRTLKSMLKSKQKFPKVLFSDLKQAFPCILAGIRDYATYIPLEKDLFDLVIIDEASQVSIAQALPALIRGKRILVLGDEKQFSNVKAGNASILTNSKYRSNLLTSLKAAIASNTQDYSPVYTARVDENFNVKKSILDFCRFITNYQTMLKKHFRCYPEVIGYSNKYFYDGNLQCMKARSLPINEVIKFTQVDTTGVKDQYRLTNTAEANFILEQFTALKNKDYAGTLGVITPHREQATFINNLLNESEVSEWLHEHKLKVMTFDTCQGEERDYILYSMVAKPDDDKHWTIFPVSMEESAKAGKELGTREQRLNVGFSRAKETVHFILSKPVTDYWGEVKTALLYYDNALNTTKHVIGGTDKNSPMEAKVQNYFYQTDFYEKNKDNIELVPQFPLGEYLKSLDKNYTHPLYKVDFLLTFGKKKIVIEYDGFEDFHFTNREEVNESNYESYLTEADKYREKVLEGYGYKFLRLNKFNLGREPVQQLDGLLADTVKKKNIQRGQLIPS